MIKKITLLLLVFLVVSFSTYASGYKKVLAENTRQSESYRLKDLHASIVWSATHLSNVMVSAESRYYAKKFALTAPEELSLNDHWLSERGSQVVFMVAFYSYDRKFSDLSNLANGWDLRLVTPDGQRITPAKIEKRPLSPIDQLLYPSITSWSKVYRVTFPINEASLTVPFKLEIHGPEAHSELSWK